MPTMGCHHGWRGVVSGHHQHIRLQLKYLGYERVQFLQASDLGIEVAVLTGGVGRLIVDEEEIVLVPVGP